MPDESLDILIRTIADTSGQQEVKKGLEETADAAREYVGAWKELLEMQDRGARPVAREDADPAEQARWNWVLGPTNFIAGQPFTNWYLTLPPYRRLMIDWQTDGSSASVNSNFTMCIQQSFWPN